MQGPYSLEVRLVLKQIQYMLLAEHASKCGLSSKETTRDSTSPLQDRYTIRFGCGGICVCFSAHLTIL